MSTTTERLSIDPYFHWLEVTTPQRPPNPYELLGLPLFETSLQRIQTAAKRKRALLESRQGTADPQVWERIQGELESAIAVLSDNTEHAILDADLRRAGLDRVAPPGKSAASSTSPSASLTASHGADETNNKGTTACVECGTSNSLERKFCQHCGQTLWDKCPQCQTPHPRSERFCGQCGVNLREHLAERESWCQLRLDAARVAQQEYRFDEAQAFLREVARIDDPRLDRFASEAKSLREPFQKARKELEADVARTIADARQQMAGHAVERAICLLEDVHERLRTSEHQSLLDEVRARHQAILALSGEIRELLAQRQTLELGPRLERLLVLKPDHKEARQLAEQLSAKLVESARKRYARHDLTGALELLRKIPRLAIDESSRKLEEEIGDAMWRLERCRSAACVSRAQLRFVDHALRTYSAHPDVPALHKQWQVWAKSPPREAWLAAADTVAPALKEAEKSAAGCLVDWIGKSLRLSAATPEVERALREHLGQWFVAQGLAIQGVGEAAVDVNLLPQEKGSVWSRLSWGRKKSNDATAWGIDLGPSSLKAILLRWDSKSQVATIEKAVRIEHDTPLESVRDESQVAERLARTLKSFVDQHPLAGHKVCFNLPSISTLCRWITLPPIADKKLEDALQFAIKQQVALPLDELESDYVSLETPPVAKGDAPTRRIAWIAAKKHVVRQRQQLWTAIDAKPDILQSDAVALHNWLRFEYAGQAARDWEPRESGEATAILDLGSDSTNLIFSAGQSLWYRAVGTASDDLTRALVRDFQVSRSDAETWKSSPQLVSRGSQYANLLAQHFDRLLDEWHRSSSQFANLFPGERPARLLLVGGGAAQWGLLEKFRT